MIIYNVTINIDDSVHPEWLKWMNETHIPEVMRTGMFLENRILRLIGEDESGGHTYSIQYSCENLEKYREYEKSFARELQVKHHEKFKDKFVAFRTLLELVK